MKRLEHLMIILAEECGEVIQATTKLLRFGPDETRDFESSRYTTNIERLRYELNDLSAMVEMLDEEIDLSTDRLSRDMKKAKVERYLLYSKKLGTLDD